MRPLRVPRMFMLVCLVLTTIVTLGNVRAAEPELKSAGAMPGDPAPPLRTSRWLRGAPIDGFKPGRVYVVDLWASWCAPCLASMPRLRKLEKRHPNDVTFVAMNVLEMQPKRVPSLVESFGDSIVRAVAMDSIPAGKEANEGLTAAGYMGASELVSLPQTFLIDRHGRVAWTGHPDSVEAVLNQVLKGTWDPEPFAKRYRSEKLREQKYSDLFGALDSAANAGDWKKAYARAENIVAADPAFAVRIANEGFAYLAMLIVNAQAPTPADLDIARRAAARAYELNPNQDWHMDQLSARVARASGDPDGARRFLEQAIRKASGPDKAKLEEELKSLNTKK